MNQLLYPLMFKAILKEKIWGGEKLVQDFGKKGTGVIGESWEISGVAGDVSVVANGPLKGRTLTSLIEEYKVDFLGDQVWKCYGTEFPLLFKFIDAKEDLSVQLHPDDALAKERHNSFGKTEMWYILDSEEDSRLILGFSKLMDEDSYTNCMAQGAIMEVLHEETVVKGDAFFIAPGTVHAIGAGVVLAEIQQTSDITYRIYDWDRPGLDGEMRALHTDLALEAINFEPNSPKLQFKTEANNSALVCKSPYFETNILPLDMECSKDVSEIDSFIVYMCAEGTATISAMGVSEVIKKGDTLLLPACCQSLTITTEGVTLLEVYVPHTNIK